MVTNAEKLLHCAEELGRECSCWEVGSCSFASDPLSTMILPFESIFAGLSFVIFWGLILSILWLRTHNPLMVGMIGTVMSSAFIAGGGAVAGPGRNSLPSHPVFGFGLLKQIVF